MVVQNKTIVTTLKKNHYRFAPISVIEFRIIRMNRKSKANAYQLIAVY